MQGSKYIVPVTGVLLALTSASKAAVLQTYFNFTTYGTQTGGASIADLTGNTTGTVNAEAHTSLTSSGLTISGGDSVNTGVTVPSSALAGVTGAFSIQDWVTLASLEGNAVLYGANNGDTNTYVGDGGTVSTLFGSIRAGAISAFAGGSTPNYAQYGRGVADGTFSASTATLYDVVLTYDGNNFNEYVNGTLEGSGLNDPTFGSLAQATSADAFTGNSGFSIGGGKNEPYNDDALQETTSDFLLYNGALTASQVSALDASGVGASLATVNSDIAVPEPGSLAIAAIGCIGLVGRRRTR